MAKVIIGIHGLGNKPPKELLESWWLESMKEGLRSIGKSDKIPHFEMIYWANILNSKPLDPRIDDMSDPYFLEDQYTPSPIGFKPKRNSFRQKWMKVIEQFFDWFFLNDDLTLNYSFISDAFIKRYFYEVGVYFNEDCADENGIMCKARDLIKQRFYEVIKKYENDEILLVCHSMGSIIAFDILSFLYSEVKINTFVTLGSPLGLPFIIAMLAEGRSIKFSFKKKLKTPPGIYNHWYNFVDLNDKIALDKTLNDDYDANGQGVKAKDYLVSNDYVINGQENPHKSFGYLRAPEFSNMLYHFLHHDQFTKHVKKTKRLKKIRRFISKMVKK